MLIRIDMIEKNQQQKEEANNEMNENDENTSKTNPQQVDDTAQIDTNHSSFLTSLSPSSSLSSPERTKQGKSILVLINPHSGLGKSAFIFKSKFLPILTKHELDHHVFISESDSRVHDYILNKSLLELLNLKCIIVVSGDGLLHETLNALMARQDRDQAMTVPIGIVPTGSGNGMAYTLLKNKYPSLTNKNDAIELCCLQAIQDQTCLADLVKITFGYSKRIVWSFLSLGWGLLSDIDIDSEWLRRIGEFRFTLYGVLRSLTSTTYRGRLSFKVAETEANGTPERSKSGDQKKLDDRITKESNISFKMYDDVNRLKINPESSSTSSTSKEEIYDDWVHVEDDFTCLYAVYQSHISSVTKFAPKSTLTDQIIYLTYIRGKLSICETVRFLLDIEDGSHENLPFVTVVPVTCFKFQPLEPSKIVVDGELISWNISDGPITAEVVPKVMKLVWENPKDMLSTSI